MGRKHLLPEEHDEYLDRLGLTDQDKRVYVSTLDSGLVSIGEIQQLTEIHDLSKILESIRDLEEIGLVKKAQGRMPRYYAILPFLRETITIEREFIYALESMIQAVDDTKKMIATHRKTVTAYDFPNFVKGLLDSYYQNILSPTLKRFESLKESVSEGSMELIKAIDSDNEAFKEEISLMVKPIDAILESLSDRLTKTVISSMDSLGSYYSSRKSTSDEHKTKLTDTISDTLGEITGSVSKFEQLINSSLESINQIEGSVSHINHNLETITPTIEDISNRTLNAKNEILAELLVIREQLSNLADQEVIDEKSNSVRKRGVSRKEIEDSFEPLMRKVGDVVIEPEKLVELIGLSTTITSEGLGHISDIKSKITTEISAQFNEINLWLNNSESIITKEILTYSDANNSDLNSLNEVLHQNLVDLNQKLEELMKIGTSSFEKHKEGMFKNHDKIFDMWQDKMISHFSEPVNIVDPIITTWIDIIEPVVEKFKEESDSMLENVLEPLSDLEEKTINTLIERINFIKAMVDGRNKDLLSITEFSNKFDYTKNSDTWVVVGLPSIYASLTDLLLRTRVSVTVVTPNVDLELIEIARKLKSTIRVTFVTDIDKSRDARLIKKLDDVGRIQLRAYDKRDIYACIRDSEEIIFGYLRSNEEMVGIRTSTPSVIELLEDRLNETIIRISKPV